MRQEPVHVRQMEGRVVEHKESWGVVVNGGGSYQPGQGGAENDIENLLLELFAPLVQQMQNAKTNI